MARSGRCASSGTRTIGCDWGEWALASSIRGHSWSKNLERSRTALQARSLVGHASIPDIVRPRRATQRSRQGPFALLRRLARRQVAHMQPAPWPVAWTCLGGGDCANMGRVVAQMRRYAPLPDVSLQCIASAWAIKSIHLRTNRLRQRLLIRGRDSGIPGCVTRG